MRVTLVDKHGTLAHASARSGWAGQVEVVAYTDVREVPLAPGTAFVSPANSLGFMDGGIDFVYSRMMFPGLEPVVKRVIAAAGQTSRLGRAFLPVGKALVVPVPGHVGVSVVVAPTMLMPQDVRGTHNAYYAMRAALEAASAAKVVRLVTPGMCTGCGMVSAPDAIADMSRAHADFLAGRPWPVTLDEIMEEQPLWYENTEFKEIPADRVLMH